MAAGPTPTEDVKTFGLSADGGSYPKLESEFLAKYRRKTQDSVGVKMEALDYSPRFRIASSLAWLFLLFVGEFC